MLDLLVSAAVFTAAVALGLGGLALLTLLPFLLALRRAEREGLSSLRCGAAALTCSLLGLALVVQVLRSSAPAVLALVGVPVALAGPLVVGTGRRVAGRAGRHQ